ncbi:hypothetical protein Q0Z83_039250 [Actinoplanes sichuanensis]|uniref:GIY-YIG nuclease family protein n=1 Tax=Actinoplanes sichuanensis TaxID=512349 RepID=A0ABW4ASP1_9ACTN|nr:hypothetical protein [Actinoplanes sichuanensis]BEL05734.1 hypothetical protein Q0Z83_039250 [Actinoplanes sichuanensis]
MFTNPGYLYVIAFDNGIFKGGCTDDIMRRYGEHRRDAGRFGLTIANWWFSEFVGELQFRENQLLRILNRMGRRSAAGREYFHDIPFSAGRAAAQRAASEPCHCEYWTSCETSLHLVGVAVAKPWWDKFPSGLDVAYANFRLGCGGEIVGELNDDLVPTGPLPIQIGVPARIDVDWLTYRGTWTVYSADYDDGIQIAGWPTETTVTDSIEMPATHALGVRRPAPH